MKLFTKGYSNSCCEGEGRNGLRLVRSVTNLTGLTLHKGLVSSSRWAGKGGLNNLGEAVKIQLYDGLSTAFFMSQRRMHMQEGM